MARERGTVVFFNALKGWGFLKRSNKPDVFCHFSSITMDGYKQLREGDVVEFDVVQGDKGLQSSDVKLIESAAAKSA